MSQAGRNSAYFLFMADQAVRVWVVVEIAVDAFCFVEDNLTRLEA